MAVITPSALISEIRGSVGTQTFSKNRYGPYVKAKLVQPPSNTLPQQDVRAAQAAAVAEWQGLSQAVMDKWINYANGNIISGRISRKFVRAGYNEYISRCMNRFAVSGAGTGFEPLPKVRLFPIITGVTTGTNDITVSFDTMKPIGNCDLVVYATPPVSAGINEINPSLYRIIGIITPAAQVSSANIYSAYNTYYGLTGADIGKKIGIAIKAINTDNFAAGQFFFAQTTISGGLVSSAPFISDYVQDPIIPTPTYTFSFSSPPQADQLILLSIRANSGTAWVIPSGFTSLSSTSDASNHNIICYKIADGSESNSFSVTRTGGQFLNGFGLYISNVNITTPVTLIQTASVSIAVATNVGSPFNAPANSLYILSTVWNWRIIASLFASPFLRLTVPEIFNIWQASFSVFFSATSNVQGNISGPMSIGNTARYFIVRVNAP